MSELNDTSRELGSVMSLQVMVISGLAGCGSLRMFGVTRIGSVRFAEPVICGPVTSELMSPDSPRNRSARVTRPSAVAGLCKPTAIEALAAPLPPTTATPKKPNRAAASISGAATIADPVRETSFTKNCGIGARSMPKVNSIPAFALKLTSLPLVDTLSAPRSRPRSIGTSIGSRA